MLSNFAKRQLIFNKELEKQKNQRESIKNKEVFYRVEYRFKGGSKSYVYFNNIKKAEMYEYKRLKYGIFGNCGFEYPLSKQLQKKGPRNGWSKYK